MHKKILILVGVVALVGAFLYWRAAPQTSVSARPTVVATLYPLAHFATQVGGINVDVIALTPPGIEPHEYEPTPQDLVKVEAAKLIVLNGGGVDAWATRLAPTWRAQGKIVLIMSEQVAFMGTPIDPHIWLDPIRAREEVAALADALTTVDPVHAVDYRARAETYEKKLDDLHRAYTTGLASCARRDMVVSHDAYQYLAARYGLQVISIAGLSPEAEPSAQRLAEITEQVKAKDIKYIFFETLAAPKLAETLARETGTHALVLNPIEGLTAADQAAGKNYDILMQENLTNLRTALVCQ